MRGRLHVPGHPQLRRIRPVRLAREFLLVTTGVLVYFGVRGLTAGSPEVARAHAGQVLRLERRLGLDLELGAQNTFVHHDRVTTVANWVYIYGHWPVIAVVLLWLALQHPGHYRLLRDAMMISGGIGLVIFASYPVAPPRLASGEIVDTVTEQSGAYRLLQPPAFVNQYAAMPSLHVGWDLLVGLTVAAVAAQLWLRVLGRLLPCLMVLAVVVTGNHYALDVLAGALLALVGLLAAERLRGYRERPHEERPHEERPREERPREERPREERPHEEPVR